MKNSTGQPLFSFCPEQASKYGLDEAIFIRHFVFWLTLNRSKKINQIEDRTWTYYSIQAFKSTYKFWTIGTIRRIINSLLDQGVLIKDYYHKNPFDRTAWYAFKNEKEFLPPLREKKSVVSDGDLSDLADSKPLPKTLEQTEPSQACTSTAPPALPISFAEDVQADYNESFQGCNLSIPKTKTIMPNLEILLEQFLKRQANPEEVDLKAKDFKAVFEQAKIELLPKPKTKGLCKWQHLLKPNIFFSLLDTARITIPSNNPILNSYKPPPQLTSEEREASLNKLEQLKLEKERAT